jgi:hypothetical protein
MKWFLSLFVLLLAFPGFAQGRAEFGRIDWAVQSLDAPTPDSLARLLTGSYTADLQKVRAIFSWITGHISYNTGIYTRRMSASALPSDPSDTASAWKEATEMAARRVLYRRFAVCEGYSRLFKTLCDYAGIRSEIISGYGRGNWGGRMKFRTNHSWNAVMIDSTWHLLDLTWASGYINYRDEFVQHTDETYFLTPPDQFIQDHYPEDLRWTLLKDPPVLREYHNAPFRYKSFVKYSFGSWFPAPGIIEASVGDTIHMALDIRDPEKDRQISSDPFFDSGLLNSFPASVFLSPQYGKNKAVYTFVVNSDNVEWIHLLYNDDLVLRYRLMIKKDPGDK